MNRFRLFVILTLLCIPMPAAAAVYQIPLKNFLATDVVELKGASANSEEREDSIPIGSRWDIQKAVLRFDYTCSEALLPGSSHLTVLVNDSPVGQIALDPRAPEGRAEITINPGNLKPGYNQLVFSVTQHTTREECEDPTLPELWTRIDLTTAELELDMSPLPVPESLGTVGDFLFDARDLVSNSLHIVVPEITRAYLLRAGLAAAGAALRREYRPIKISLSDQLIEGQDNLVIGPPQFLETLKIHLSKSKAGPLIAVTRLPISSENEDSGEPAVDIYNGVVCLTGDTDADLDLAARAFSLMSTPFPQAPAVAVADVEEPGLSTYRFRNAVLEDRDYSFASLGLGTTTFRGTQASPKKISLRLPSDAHIEPNQALMISLDLAYGSGMRSDSALNLEVNGKFVAAIPLSNSNGGSFQGYKVQVLGSALHPGVNILRLVPVLISPVSDPCAPIQTGNLALTVFEDSSLTVPDYGHWIRMPRLDAFMVDAFPFGRWPDLRETTVCLPEATFSQAAAVLNLVAMISQKIGYPPTELGWYLGPLDEAPQGRDLILAGTLKNFETGLPETGAKNPLLPGEISRILYPQLSRPDGRQNLTKSWRERLSQWLGKSSDPLPAGRQVDSAMETLGVQDLSGWGFIAELARNKEAERTLLVLTAQTENDLLRTGTHLWDSGLQASVSGGAAAIHLTSSGTPRVTVLDTGETYYLGKVEPVPTITNLINRYPWRALLLLLVILGICSLLIYIALKKIRRKRQTDA